MMWKAQTPSRACLFLVALLVAVSSSGNHVAVAFTPSAGRAVARSSSTSNRALAFSAPKNARVTTTSTVASTSSTRPTTQLQGLSDAVAGAAAGTTTATVADGQLMTFFLQTLIANGIPAVFTILVIGFTVILLRPKKDNNSRDRNSAANIKNMNNPAARLYNDLYGDQQQDMPGSGSMGGSAVLKKLFGGDSNGAGNNAPFPQNVGIPDKQYIKMTHLNRKLDSYQFSVTAAVQSRAAAAAEYRQTSLSRALKSSVSSLMTGATTLEPVVMQALVKAEQAFLEQGSALVQEIQQLQTELTAVAVDEQLESMGVAKENVFSLAPDSTATSSDATSTTSTTRTVSPKKPKNGQKKTSKKNKKLLDRLTQGQLALAQAELAFVQSVVSAVGPASAASVRTALLGDIAARGTGGLLTQMQDRPLTALLGHGSGGSSNGGSKPTVFVTRFPGDLSASQVVNLREEVTAIVRQAKPGDEAVVILQTGGGTVTGYGLAAAQLLRFKEAGLKLTVAVEQVAASGGYMMCCVADRIVASPFAVLGSIGVISEQPNVYERLKKEGIEYQTVTAGKYKRTLTPTKKVTKEDFEKSKADVEGIWVLFRDFVAQNRPQLDIENVATGETWFGTDALEKGLCDEIKTVDSVLTDFVDADYDVYEVSYEPPKELKFALPLGLGAEAGGQDTGILGRGVRWLVRTAAAEVKAELGGAANLDLNQSVEKRYMAVDDSADRVRSQD